MRNMLFKKIVILALTFRDFLFNATQVRRKCERPCAQRALLYNYVAGKYKERLSKTGADFDKTVTNEVEKKIIRTEPNDEKCL